MQGPVLILKLRQPLLHFIIVRTLDLFDFADVVIFLGPPLFVEVERQVHLLAIDSLGAVGVVVAPHLVADRVDLRDRLFFGVFEVPAHIGNLVKLDVVFFYFLNLFVSLN